MSAHLPETELALLAGGDLSGWQRVRASIHVSRCANCRTLIEAFRADKETRALDAGDLPPGLDWERLSAEMTANIHLGLAAGECVTPAQAASNRNAGRNWGQKWLGGWQWRPAALVAALVMVFSTAAWMNLPVNEDWVIVRGAFQRLFEGKAGVPVDQGPVVAASYEGIQFSENESGLGMSPGKADPVAVSVSFDGTASAQYVDDGGVTITTVYTQ